MLHFHPQPIGKKFPFSRFTTIESSTDFFFQKRKAAFRSKDKPLYRIVTRDRIHGCHYQVVTGSDYGELKANEWKYLTSNLAMITPHQLSLTDRTSWLLSHLMQLAIDISASEVKVTDEPIPPPQSNEFIETSDDEEENIILSDSDPPFEKSSKESKSILSFSLFPFEVEAAIISCTFRIKKSKYLFPLTLFLINLFYFLLHYDYTFFIGILIIMNIIGMILIYRHSTLPIKRKQGNPLTVIYNEEKKEKCHSCFIPGASVKKLDSYENMVECSWTPYPANVFSVRQKGYLKSSFKAPSLPAIYDIFAYDLFGSDSKIDNIGRAAKFPDNISDVAGFPKFIIFNCQLPDYPPSWLGGPYDGQGYMFVFYMKISDWAREAIASGNITPAMKLLQRFLKLDPEDNLTQRVKAICRMDDIDQMPLGSFLKPMCHKFNMKPFLCRPQIHYYQGPDYFEVDLDIHRFKFLARKIWSELKGLGKSLKFELSIVLEGHNDEELPEQILGAWCGYHIGIDSATEFNLKLPPCEPDATGDYLD